jgi:hypothetical protein
MELTKEYLDQVVAGLATKADLGGLATKADLDGMARKADFDGMATKADLSELATRQDVRDLRAEMNLKFDAVLELLDVRDRVDELQRQMREVRSELNLA